MSITTASFSNRADLDHHRTERDHAVCRMATERARARFDRISAEREAAFDAADAVFAAAIEAIAEEDDIAWDVRWDAEADAIDARDAAYSAARDRFGAALRVGYRHL